MRAGVSLFQLLASSAQRKNWKAALNSGLESALLPVTMAARVQQTRILLRPA
jgi:hypothetical protein